MFRVHQHTLQDQPLCSKPTSRELLVEDVGAEPVAGALDLGD